VVVGRAMKASDALVLAEVQGENGGSGRRGCGRGRPGKLLGDSGYRETVMRSGVTTGATACMDSFGHRRRGGAMLEEKRAGTDRGMKVFAGRDGKRYRVFGTLDGSFHAFVEVEAKQAARDYGADELANTRLMSGSLWDRQA
jgi:hypothetical protein